MKLVYTSKFGDVVHFDCPDQATLFDELAHFQEVFEERVCGKCASTDTRFVVRMNDDNKYYEMHCNKCRAKFIFGSNKKGGGLFPKRFETYKDGDKEKSRVRGTNGWVKWNPQTNQEE